MRSRRLPVRPAKALEFRSLLRDIRVAGVQFALQVVYAARQVFRDRDVLSQGVECNQRCRVIADRQTRVLSRFPA